MSEVVSINGYSLHMHDGQPMVGDLELAERLGYAQPRDIRKLVKRLLESGRISPDEVRATVARLPNGSDSTSFHLGEKATLKIIVKSETEKADQITDEIIDVFIECRSTNKPAIPQSFPEALRLAAAAMEERDKAIATKAEIGSRREATAMSTASTAVRKAKKLEVELDQSREYCTVKRMQMIHHGQRFNWRLLKSTAAEMQIPTKDVFDTNYGTVKAYHADVWLEAYAVSIEEEMVA